MLLHRLGQNRFTDNEERAQQTKSRYRRSTNVVEPPRVTGCRTTGLSRAEISDQLGVSRKCVSVFIERARGKFHLTTALQLRHLAFRLASFGRKKAF